MRRLSRSFIVRTRFKARARLRKIRQAKRKVKPETIRKRRDRRYHRKGVRIRVSVARREARKKFRRTRRRR